MLIAEHVDAVAAEAAALVGAAETAGLDAPVAHLEWTVRDVLVHIGGVHRWAADMVGHARTGYETEAGAAVGSGPPDAQLLDWVRAGAADVVAALRAAPPDLQCVAFLPAPSPLAFWARRQAHETGIHRVDVESARGDVTPFDAAFAQDGIAELLHGFAARRSLAIPVLATIVLRPSDGPAWTIDLGGERTQAQQGDRDADLAVIGSSSDVYCWLWNRPSGAAIIGDPHLADRWAGTVRVAWS